MKTSMESQFTLFIPDLIQKVDDFEYFIKGYAKELKDWRKYVFSCSSWTTMNNLYFNAMFLHLFQSGCRETI